MARRLLAMILVSALAGPATTAETELGLRFAAVALRPYAWSPPGGAPEGILVDFSTAIADRSGLEILDEVMPLRRMVRQVEIGASDCGIFIRAQALEQRFQQVAEVLPTLESVVVTRLGLTIEAVTDLRGYVLGHNRGTFAGSYIAESPEIERIETNSYAHSVRLFRLGRVDAIAGTALSIYHHLDRAGFSPGDLGGVLVFNREPVWLQCTRDRLAPELLTRLRSTIDGMRRAGAFERIVARYAITDFRLSRGGR